MLAFIMYSDDNNGVMPGTEFERTFMSGGGYWAGPRPALSTGISSTEAKKRVEAGLKIGPLWKYCSNVETYHCPGDNRFKFRKPGANWAYDSYSKTDGMNGDQWETTTTPSIKKLEAVPEPAQSLVFVEEPDSRDYNLGTWVIDAPGRKWVDPVAAFHLNANTMSFADGHVEGHRWVEATTLRAARAAESNRETPFSWAKSKPDRDFAWVEARYKYGNWPKYYKP
jgi:prepilin-type processing-associated H-X9-DG protein